MPFPSIQGPRNWCAMSDLRFFVKVDCDLHVGNLLEVTLFQQREKSAGDEVDTCYIDVECRVEVRPVSKGRQSRSASWEREFPSSNGQQVGNEPGPLTDTSSQFHQGCYSMRQHY